MKKILLISLVLLVTVGAHQAFANEIYPKSWQKFMTTDPNTNFALRKYGFPLSADPLVLHYQNLQITSALQYCSGMKMNKKVLTAFLSKTDPKTFSKKQRFEAHFIVSSKFNDFSYQDLAELCSGAPYLYGKQGVLIPNALSKAGKGIPNYGLDDRGPYLKIEIPE